MLLLLLVLFLKVLASDEVMLVSLMTSSTPWTCGLCQRVSACR